MINTQNADVYTDFNGLAKLKNEAKSKTPEAIKEVAKQFESIFLNRVLKTMREAKLAEGAFDNQQSEFYQDMYDQQLSIHLSGQGGVGLAELIVKQLSPKEHHENEVLGLDDYRKKPVNSLRPVNSQSQQLNTKETADSEIEISAGSKKKTEFPEQKSVIEKNEVIQTPVDFVNHLQPYAEKAAAELGVDAKVLLAQSALETGWGKFVIKDAQGENSHNLFNIKANNSWKGAQTQVATLEYKNGELKEEMAGFRSYSSYAESFTDYVSFIKNNPRYAQALDAVSDPDKYMQELQQAGYATDPEYAQKVMSIYHSEAISSLQPSSVVAMK